jgi:bla regulator protein BlaR1
MPLTQFLLPMNQLEQVMPPALLRAVGFTLLHSLWQGVALALVVALLLRLLQRQAALVRYRLAAVALLTLGGLAVVTFSYYYVQEPTPVAASQPAVVVPSTYPAPLVITSKTAAVLSANPTTAWRPLLAATTSYLERHLGVLVGLWLLGFVVMTVRLLAAFAYVRRLRGQQVSAVPVAWQQCLARLVARTGLHLRVQLLASSLVPSPLVIGHLKPVILLPLGVLNGLAPAEAEMILAHELAHIMRKDYLFNFVQAVAEVVFFYHPAVWFLSAVLHTERENCCDDLATQLGGSPRQLAHALASLAELTYFAPAPRLALALAGHGDSLLSRIQRLARPRPARATGLWPASCALLGVGLLLGGLLLAARAATPPHKHLTATRTRRATTRKSRPDTALRTGRPPLAASDEALQGVFQTHLLAEGLLPAAANYTLSLTATQFAINHVRQSATVAARYQRLYEAATGYRMTATTQYYTANEVVDQVGDTPPLAVHRPLPLPGPAAGAEADSTGSSQLALLQQLRRDGLVGPFTQHFTVEVTKAGVFLVNGQPQPASLLATYRPLFHLPARTAGGTTTIKLSVR